MERPVDIVGKEDDDDETGQPGEIHEYSNQIAHLGKTVLVDEVAYIEEREDDLGDDDLQHLSIFKISDGIVTN